MKKLDIPERPIDMTGMFMGVYQDDKRPVVFVLEDAYFLPVFSTAQKYEDAMRLAQIKDARVQIITDGLEFLHSLQGKIRVMLDPWRTDRGTTRFTEVSIPGASEETDPPEVAT